MDNICVVQQPTVEGNKKKKKRKEKKRKASPFTQQRGIARMFRSCLDAKRF